MDIQLKKRRFPISHKTITIIAIAAGVAIAAAIVVLQGGASAMRVERESLLIGDVTRGQFDDYVRILGKVQPLTSIQLSAEEGGIVDRIFVEEGTRVVKGQPIAQLRNSSLDLEILNAEANLAEKQNFLRNTQVTMEQDKLSNRTEKLQLDIDVRQKRRTFEQYKRLLDEDLISKEEYLKAQEDFQLASEKRKLVCERLRQDSIYRSIQISQLESDLQNMRLSLDLIRQRRDKLTVCASADGELGQMSLELGQTIASGQMIGRINVVNGHKMEADIDEHYIDRIATGLTGTMERGKSTYQVMVGKVYPDVRDSKFRIDMQFVGNVPANMRNGQTNYVNLRLGEPSTAIMIPRGSFFTTTGGNWIFVIGKDGKTAHRRSVKIGRQNPSFYEVIEGLQPGERVVIGGYDNFGDCTKLIIE